MRCLAVSDGDGASARSGGPAPSGGAGRRYVCRATPRPMIAMSRLRRCRRWRLCSASVYTAPSSLPDAFGAVFEESSPLVRAPLRRSCQRRVMLSRACTARAHFPADPVRPLVWMLHSPLPVTEVDGELDVGHAADRAGRTSSGDGL